ncbi:ArsR/SmtB family transcription factor [Amycolatopsis jejuensis]|uniref:ArsR/SmtB family transcription factor n=1 Tax=Amycolatopsis jejuensis TaxID=330084 RepID=UPI0006912CC9|nr:metalloregulator ArsR/SmtB family transcription factor [Amycolatopsis jejuensis]
MSGKAAAAPEVFKALGDPIRWNIVQQLAQQDEVPCSLLEDTLPVSKPTISYHTKILSQAGLLDVHKRGRNYYYTLRADALRHLIGDLQEIVPAEDEDISPAPRRKAKAETAPRSATLLTW